MEGILPSVEGWKPSFPGLLHVREGILPSDESGDALVPSAAGRCPSKFIEPTITRLSISNPHEPEARD